MSSTKSSEKKNRPDSDQFKKRDMSHLAFGEPISTRKAKKTREGCGEGTGGSAAIREGGQKKA